MTLEASFDLIDLTPERPFRIARGTTEARPVAIVRIRDGEGRTGLGCASPSTFYGESIETVEDVLPRLIACVEDVGDPFAVADVHARMYDAVDGSHPAARAGIDIALHDLIGRRIGVPLYRFLGFGGGHRMRTSYTIGIDTPDGMAAHAREAVDAGFEVLKVKLGTPEDDVRIRRVSAAAPAARIRVDANGAWDVDRALELIDLLAEHEVEFVEQPVPADDLAALADVHERSPLPVAADESCRDATDVPQVAGRCDIITVKLMKTGGIRGALEQIHAARAHGCDVMLGCMLESDASIAAAAHLIPYAQYADLDGSILVADDPFRGAPFDGDAIELHPGLDPGTGVQLGR